MIYVVTTNGIKTITLEQPASVRRQQSNSDERGWILPVYCVGTENESLDYLFGESQIARLAELSPIVLMGGKGVGKTCLAVTLAVRWSRHFNARPLHFTTGHNYCRDLISAYEIDDVDHFHQRHRRCKLLVIDDLEPLFAKVNAQQELLHSLDVMANEQRPVILSISRLPAAESGVLPALASRIAGGYSVDLQPPSPSTCEEIVRMLVKRLDPELPINDLLRAIRSQSAPLNANDLNAFVALASQHRKSSGRVDSGILVSIAEQVSSGTLPTVTSIAKAVAKRMGIKLTELRSATRQSKVVRARALAIVLSRKLTALSLQDIGAYFGGRDHSTVLHSCRKIDKLLLSDAELAAAKQDVEVELLKRRSSLI